MCVTYHLEAFQLWGSNSKREDGRPLQEYIPWVLFGEASASLRSNSPVSAPLSVTHAPVAGVILHMWQLVLLRAASPAHSWEQAAHTSVCYCGSLRLSARKNVAYGTRTCHADPEAVLRISFQNFSLRILRGKMIRQNQGGKQDREARKEEWRMSREGNRVHWTWRSGDQTGIARTYILMHSEPFINVILDFGLLH